jgi:hypothetical protein
MRLRKILHILRGTPHIYTRGLKLPHKYEETVRGGTPP